MKHISIFMICLLLTMQACGQNETFDIVSYTTPKNWKKELTDNHLVYSKIDGNSWGQIVIYKSAVSTGDAETDNEKEWNGLVLGLKAIENEEKAKPDTLNNWVVISRSGIWKYNGANVSTILTTFSNGKVYLSAMCNATALPYLQDFQNLLQTFQPIERNEISPNQTYHTVNGQFKYDTTNFDDGWISAIKTDWVEVTKPGTRIFIHYPNQRADEHNFDKLKGDEHAWNALVAPRYQNITNFQQRGLQGSPSITFLTANGVEKQTGKNVFIVFYKKHYQQGNGRYLEVVTNSKTDFENEFGNNYINTSSWDYLEQSKSWDKLAKMQWRNKFAVANTDLAGKWSSSDFASLSYYYVSSGRYAGSTATATSDEFNFLNANHYSSQHSGASGQVGNMGFSTQKYNGRYEVKDWKITFTNRFKGQLETFNCQFEAVKGGRILVLTDNNNTIKALVKQH
ncbi:hypothetical protein [Pedobacter ginsenosidimutans]|nr:hypothetical protein [Pedobacter ginsenosidimutans]